MLPIISVVGGSATETGTVDFIVTLNEASLGDVSVQYRTVQDGSAFSDYDFDGITGTLTIAAGQTTGTISVRHFSDSVDANDQNYTLVLADPTNAVLEGNEATLQATGVILDNDGTTSDWALFVSDPVIIETDTGGKQAVFKVRISESSGSPITLSYATADGTALAGADYTAASGAVTFAPGETVKTVTIDIVGDTVSEGTEQFSLVVTPTGAIANGVSDSTGIATITDDDTTTNLPVVSLLGAEGVETEEVAFQILLSEPSLTDVEVQYRTVQTGTALSDVDFNEVSGTIIIPAGEVSYFLPINLFSDSVDSGDQNFTLEISNPTNAVLSGDEDTLTATGVVQDNDGSIADRGLFVSDPVIIETDAGTKLAVFEVTLSEPSATTVSLSYATVDGTATAGEDYTAISGVVTFLPGQTLASVSVEVTGDTTLEVAETFSLLVTPNAAITNGVADSAGIATITDNDGGNGLPVISILPDVGPETEQAFST